MHGVVAPLWRGGAPTYEAFAEHLGRAGELPTYLPWPPPPGWQVSGFACVGESGSPRATMTCSTGTTPDDGVVDVMVVAEEAGTGLGARVAGVSISDPEIGAEPPALRIRVDQGSAAMWTVAADAPTESGATVLLGEQQGRWLWVVVRPAVAVLLLARWRQLKDVSADGPSLLDLAFGGIEPRW